MIHNLEDQWWPKTRHSKLNTPQITRSLISTTPQGDQIYVTIDKWQAFLPLKWRPILATLDLCQLHAWSTSTCDGSLGKTGKKLTSFYDHARIYLIAEAETHQGTRRGNWIPEVIHRLLVRLTSEQTHHPTYLHQNEGKLLALYNKTTPFSYGK